MIGIPAVSTAHAIPGVVETTPATPWNAAIQKNWYFYQLTGLYSVWVAYTGQHNILIVDDEPSLRRILGVSLTALGFDTAEASSGEQALALLETRHYDVVLLDVEMPGMGGIETCREIQAISPRPAVVMLTVRDGNHDKAKAFEAGADEYITKPYRLRDLVTRLRSLLEGAARPDESTGLRAQVSHDR
jgi:DNA-binding response OmpR family regulator